MFFPFNSGRVYHVKNKFQIFFADPERVLPTVKVKTYSSEILFAPSEGIVDQYFVTIQDVNNRSEPLKRKITASSRPFYNVSFTSLFPNTNYSGTMITQIKDVSSTKVPISFKTGNFAVLWMIYSLM